MKRIDKSELIDILSGGENDQLEFKEHITNVEIAAKYIVSFANTNGGRLIVGYSERTKSIIGITPKDRMLIDKAIESIADLSKIDVYTLDFDKKGVLVVDVEKQEQGVVFLNGRMFSRNHQGITIMGEKEIAQRMANAPNDKLLDAITKLNNQNEQLVTLTNKNARSSTILSIITCVAGALLGTLFGYLLGLFI